MPREVFVYILFFSIISILVVFYWGYFKRTVRFQKGSLFYNVLRFLQTIPLFILSGLAPQFSMSQPLHFQLVIITTKFRKRRQKGNWGNRKGKEIIKEFYEKPAQSKCMKTGTTYLVQVSMGKSEKCKSQSSCATSLSATDS